MDRTMSSSSCPQREHRGQNDGTNTPPWEQRALPQVPYMDAGSRSLSDTELNALPDLWATSSHATPKRMPSISIERKASATPRDQTLPSSPKSHADMGGSWASVPPHLTTPPYETPVSALPGPRAAYPLPAAPEMLPELPPTPPKSLSKASSFSTAASSPPSKSAPAIMALPGTMSSRTRKPSRSRTRTSNRNHGTSRHEKPDNVGLGKRFKLALKDIFKRNPVDESQFEHLDYRHWTEED